MEKLLLSREQCRELDRRAIEDYGMSGLVLMENAGRGCADLVCELGVDGLVVVCCGKGNNGGDGFVIARHLEARNLPVQVWVFCDPAELSGDAAVNYQILLQSESKIAIYGDANVEQFQRDLESADWVIDALLGTGVRGEPRPPLDQAIDLMNAVDCKKLAVDLPSGMDCDTGEASDHAFQADHTCTFVGRKQGFSSDSANQVLGQVHVLPIGIPRKLLEFYGFSGGI